MEEGRAAAPPERPKVLGTVKQPALFMANVPMDTSQNDVYNHFTKQKDIKINRVEMSLSGNPSLGIEKQKLNAIIHFYDHDEADRVLQYFKIQKFRDRQYCLTWYETQPNKERREWNLFVEGLPPSWGNEELVEEFSPFGSIVSVKIGDTGPGATKGFGWIQFEEQKSAQAAIQALNDNTVKDSKSGQEFKLSVSYYHSHKSCNVYVSNIPSSLFSEQALTSLFSVYGKVNSVSLSLNRIPPSAFVNFESVETAQKAIAEAKNLQLPDDNRGPLHVSPQFTKKELQRQNQHGQPRGGEENKGQTTAPAYKNYNDSNLFIRPIPPHIGEAEVKEVFSKYGDVQSILIRSIRNDPSNRKGFVLLANSTQAFNAIKALDGTHVWNVMLSVKLYENAHERRKQYQRDTQGADMQNPIAMFYTFMRLLMYNPGAQRHHHYRNNYGGGSGYPYQNTYQGDQLPGADYGYRGRGRGGYNRGQQQRGRGDMRRNAGGNRRGHGGGAFHHVGALPGPPPQAVQQHQIPQAQQAPPPPQGYVAQAAPEMPGQTNEAVLTSKLNSMSPDERRQFIGNNLFPEVQKKLPLNAGKITGMLVDLNTEQVVQLMTNQDQLNNIIDQAYQQLHQSGMLVAEETATPGQ